MGMKNGVFWSEIGLGFGERGGTPPPRIPRSTPRGWPLNVGLYFSLLLSKCKEDFRVRKDREQRMANLLSY